jgi:hypothetical protein
MAAPFHPQQTTAGGIRREEGNGQCDNTEAINNPRQKRAWLIANEETGQQPPFGPDTRRRPARKQPAQVRQQKVYRIPRRVGDDLNGEQANAEGVASGTQDLDKAKAQTPRRRKVTIEKIRPGTFVRMILHALTLLTLLTAAGFSVLEKVHYFTKILKDCQCKL